MKYLKAFIPIYGIHYIRVHDEVTLSGFQTVIWITIQSTSLAIIAYTMYPWFLK